MKHHNNNYVNIDVCHDSVILYKKVYYFLYININFKYIEYNVSSDKL